MAAKGNGRRRRTPPREVSQGPIIQGNIYQYHYALLNNTSGVSGEQLSSTEEKRKSTSRASETKRSPPYHAFSLSQPLKRKLETSDTTTGTIGSSHQHPYGQALTMAAFVADEPSSLHGTVSLSSQQMHPASNNQESNVDTTKGCTQDCRQGGNPVPTRHTPPQIPANETASASSASGTYSQHKQQDYSLIGAIPLNQPQGGPTKRRTNASTLPGGIQGANVMANTPGSRPMPAQQISSPNKTQGQQLAYILPVPQLNVQISPQPVPKWTPTPQATTLRPSIPPAVPSAVPSPRVPPTMPATQDGQGTTQPNKIAFPPPNAAPTVLEDTVNGIDHDSLRPYDVLRGRGGNVNAFQGNQTFRSVVNDYLETYKTSKAKGSKRNIAKAVVIEIRYMLGGRFLDWNDDTELWYEIGDEKAITKTLAVFRDLSKPKKENSSANDSSYLT